MAFRGEKSACEGRIAQLVCIASMLHIALKKKKKLDISYHLLSPFSRIYL